MFGNTNYIDVQCQISKTGIIGRSKIKRVFDYPMCAHVWAQQTQEDGRSTKGQMYFHGETIFSYGSHFPIARYTDAKFEGARVVLFNSGKYSNTTSAHVDCVRRALHDLPVKIFNVPYPCGQWAADSLRHEENLDSMVSHFNETAKRLAKAHVHVWHGWEGDERIVDTAERRAAMLAPLAEDIRDYCTAFELPHVAIDLAARVAAIYASFELYNSPKKVAAREASANKRLLRHVAVMSAYHAYLEGVTDTQPNANFLPREFAGISKWRIQSNMRDVFNIRHPRANSSKPVTVTDWLNGIGSSYQNFNATLVRRKGDTLETSQGAECPFKHSVVAFLKAQQCRAASSDWHTNGEQVRVGVFKVDAIDTLGNLKAGCHTITFEAMATLAMREVPHLVKPCFPLPAII